MNNQELLSYFNLHSLPFTKEIPLEQLQLLPSVEKSLQTLMLLAQTRGIGTMTGETGTGKSCLLRLLFSKLSPGLYKPLYICHTTVGILEFYTHLCSAFGLEPVNRRAGMFRRLKERILSMNSSSHIHPILAIDESHLLSNDILSELRLLSNFELDSQNALTVVLCGQESLNLKFGLSTLAPLANSITVNIQVKSLAKEESFSYIENRICSCGVSNSIFTKNALGLIHQASGGILRTINNISHASLIKAYMANSVQVEAEYVQSVIER